MRKGLELFGQAGLKAMEKEMRQFNDWNIMSPVHILELTKQQKNRALSYLVNLKQEQDGSIKRRGYDDGKEQRLWQNNSAISSPTLSIKSLFLTCTIDTKERRDVAAADLPEFILHTPTNEEEDLIPQLDKQMTQALLRIDPNKYGNATTWKMNNPITYGKAN